MGATNSTLHYQLSQFVSTDKPAWLQDYNGDMQKIDTGINGALVAAESAQNSADAANTGVGTVSDAVTALQTTVAGHTSDITDLVGDVNTIEALIGNGTPTAGDHTLIGAINTNTGDITTLNLSKANKLTFIDNYVQSTSNIDVSDYDFILVTLKQTSGAGGFGTSQLIPTSLNSDMIISAGILSTYFTCKVELSSTKKLTLTFGAGGGSAPGLVSVSGM